MGINKRQTVCCERACLCVYVNSVVVISLLQGTGWDRSCTFKDSNAISLFPLLSVCEQMAGAHSGEMQQLTVIYHEALNLQRERDRESLTQA